MELIQNILPENITYATGIMLLHMIWQGLAIALLLGFALIILRKSSPQSRYIVSILAFSLLPITAIITFITQLRLFNYANEINASYISNRTIITINNNGIIDNFLALYVNYLPIIVMIWIIGISILLLKSLGQLIVLQRLKNYLLEDVADSIKNTINSISDKFKIYKKVFVYISQKVHTPIIIGHSKPVLLLPESSINDLSEDELKAVLHHELAHIKQNDYLINIIQTIIEILFFFHPATWWMSGIIRREREECCDAYAIESNKDKIILAKALTTIQETKLQKSSLAMSALGNNNNLISRIKKMFTNRPVSPSFKEGFIVALFFVIGIALMSFMINDNSSNQTEKEKATLATVNCELSNGKHLFAKTDSSGSITKLFIEGKKVGKRKYLEYQNIVDSLTNIQLSNSKIAESSYSQISQNISSKNTYSKEIAKEIQEAFDDAKKDLSKKEKDQLQKEIKQPNENISSILNEVMKTVSKELKNVLGEDLNFDINIDEENEKVIMNIDDENFLIDVNDNGETVVIDFNENGFFLDVNEDGEQVKMSFDENGFNLNVIENGKNTVNIKFGTNGMKIDVDE